MVLWKSLKFTQTKLVKPVRAECANRDAVTLSLPPATELSVYIGAWNHFISGAVSVTTVNQKVVYNTLFHSFQMPETFYSALSKSTF